MLKKALLYEANLSSRHHGGARVERILKTNKRHPWSKKALYALYRFGRTPIVLFVPTPSQMTKIRARSGIIRIYTSQTEGGSGLGI